MSVNTTIPVGADVLQTANYASLTELILHPTNGYLYGCYSPRGIVKIGQNNYADVTIAQFSNDGKHGTPIDMVYVPPPKDRFYVLFRIEGPSNLLVSEVNPSTLAMTDFISDDELNVGPGSITTDNLNLYVVSFNEDPSVIYAYSLATGLYVPGASGALTGFTQAHCIRYFGTKLFIQGMTPPVNGWVMRVSTAGVIEETATFLGEEGEWAVDDIGESVSHIYIGNRDLLGVIRKYSKTDFTNVTLIQTGQLSRCTCVKTVAGYVWSAFENGRGVRIRPADILDQRIYTLNEGQGYHSEFTGSGEFIHTYNQGKVSRYHIPGDVIAGTVVWAKGFGSTGFDSGQGVVVDGSGNIYITGHFEGTVDFTGNNTGTVGNGLLTSAGSSDVFVAKYSSTGSHIWSNRFGGTGLDKATSIALDDSGNIFVGGSFSGASLMKLSAQGIIQWTKGPGTFDSIAVDSQGNVVATGWFIASFAAPLDFGDGKTLYSAGTDAFLAKYSPSGTCLWAKSFANSGDKEYGTGVAVDKRDDTIFLTGWSFYDINLGGANFLNGSWGAFGFLGKFTPAGDHIWSRTVGLKTPQDNTLAWTRIGPILVDANGDVVLGGTFNYQANFGGGTVFAATVDRNAYVAKYAGNDGHYLWAQAITGNRACWPYGIAADAQNNIILTGNFYGTYDFGGQTLSNPVNIQIWDGFVAKYQSTGGNLIWARDFGGTNSDTGFGVAVDSSGNPIVTGYFSGTGIFDAHSLIGAGSLDCFLIKMIA